MFTIDDQEICRSCGAPKLQDEKDLVQCSRCYTRSIELDNTDDLYAFMARDTELISSENEQAVKELPVPLLRILAVSGMKFRFANDDDPMFVEQAKPSDDLRERLLALVREHLPADVEVPDDTKVLSLKVCDTCGELHQTSDASHDKNLYAMFNKLYAMFNKRLRLLVFRTDVTPDMMKHSLVTAAFSAFGEKIETIGEALQTIQELRLMLLENSLSDRKWKNFTKEEKMRHSKDVVVSVQSTGDWQDFLAQCVLAYLDQNIECSSERLQRLYPDAWNFSKHLIEMVERELNTFLKEREVTV